MTEMKVLVIVGFIVVMGIVISFLVLALSAPDDDGWDGRDE